MTDSTKRIILRALYNKDNYGKHYNEAAEVLSVLEDGVYTNSICESIFASALSILKSEGKTDANSLLKILSTPFCLELAYDYIKFMQNSHELSDLEMSLM